MNIYAGPEGYVPRPVSVNDSELTRRLFWYCAVRLCPHDPRMLVIDGLNECEDKKRIEKLIHIIDNACLKPSFTLRFLTVFAAEVRDATTIQHADTELWKDDTGVCNFLEARFKKILEKERKRGCMADVKAWPSPEDMEKLVKKSEGLFIWADTVSKFVGSGDPQEQLQSALKVPRGLDPLYRKVFEVAQ